MHGLTGVTAGRYTVTTEAAEYLLDLDRRVVRRLPVGPDAADLRRDAEEVTLLAIARCEVGQSMKILVDLDVSGVLVTTRRTTPIVTIERFLDSLSDAAGS